MKNASKAMKDIHGNLTIDKVDDIMYVVTPYVPQSSSDQEILLVESIHYSPVLFTSREGLGEQRALAEEIGNAIANGPQAGEPIDESELEDEISRLEQENLDEKMTNTGMTVPQLPTGLNGECKSLRPPISVAEARHQAARSFGNNTADLFASTVTGRVATKPMHEEEDEEEELRKLQAEMAM